MKVKAVTGWAVVRKNGKLNADNIWSNKKQAKFLGNKIIKVKIIPINVA